MADYPTALYDSDTPAGRKDSTLDLDEWSDAIDEITAIEVDLGVNHGKRSYLNLLRSSDFQSWSAGSSAAPDHWDIVGGATVTQETTIFRSGASSVKIVSASTGDQGIEQSVATLIGGTSPAVGQRIAVGAWVYTTASSGVEIKITDGVGTTTSTAAAGTGAWERLTCTHVVNSGATEVTVQLLQQTAITVYWASAVCTHGSTPLPYFEPNPLDCAVEIKDFTNAAGTNFHAAMRVELIEVKIVWGDGDAIGTEATGTGTLATPFRTIAMCVTGTKDDSYGGGTDGLGRRVYSLTAESSTTTVTVVGRAGVVMPSGGTADDRTTVHNVAVYGWV